jgi:Phospholipid methyltransferase
MDLNKNLLSRFSYFSPLLLNTRCILWSRAYRSTKSNLFPHWYISEHFLCADLYVDHFRVYQLLGEAGTYYGVRFGKTVPWVTEFPFGYIKDPQYTGSVLSLLAFLCWVPMEYVMVWIIGYIFMIWVEFKEDQLTRAKSIS